METPWTAAHQASLSFTISRSFLKLMSIESVMQSSHCLPLLLCLPCCAPFCPQSFPASGSFPMSQIVESGGQRTEASASIFPINSQGVCQSLRIDRFDLFAIQRTFRSLLQHHSSKALILWHSAFMV